MSAAVPETHAAEGSVKVRLGDDGIAWITLANASRFNAMSPSMWQTLGDALEALVTNAQVRCCVLTGEGQKAFCAGADISRFEDIRSDPALAADYDRLTKTTLARLQAFPKPTIAMVAGYCLGAGVALACACDLRVAAIGSRFGVPAAKLGIAYFFAGVQRLTALVGPSQTKRLLFTGEKFPAEDMLRIGLVDELVEPADLESHTVKLARAIAANAPLSVAAAKQAVQALELLHGDTPSSGEALCNEREQACANSHDHAEGRRAFMEKRAPVFVGR